MAMLTRFGLALTPLLLCFAIGCAPQRGDGGAGDNNPPGGTGGPCTSGQTSCSGQSFQVCQDGAMQTRQTCPASEVCDDHLGCVACHPGGTTCQGDAVVQCTASGALGTPVTTCDPGQCQGGHCLTGQGNCADGTQLIYVVSDTYDFLSFDPSGGKNTFTRIGTLKCPAGLPLPGWNGDTDFATPFSMSVDRSAQAWVLYTSGEIFWVDTKTAACKATSYKTDQSNFELFGMGFVSTTAGSQDEDLYVCGGTAAHISDGRLGKINKQTFQLTPLGMVEQNQESPELTGTGNGELWGYFPGSGAFVAHLDKSKGATIKKWAVAPLTDTVTGWAFAHWGGKYYIFVTTEDDAGNDNSQVHLFDPADGSTRILLQNLDYKIVGAGVSTCAPVTIG